MVYVMRVTWFFTLIDLGVWAEVLARFGVFPFAITREESITQFVLGIVLGILISLLVLYYTLRTKRPLTIRNTLAGVAILLTLIAGSLIMLAFSILDLIRGGFPIAGLVIWSALAISASLYLYQEIKQNR